MKQLRVLPVVCAVLAMALLASSCGSGSSSDGTVIASINGRDLTQGQLDDMLPDGDNTVDTRVASVVSGWLVTQAIEFELADRGFTPTDDEIVAAQEFVDTFRSPRNDTEEERDVNENALRRALQRWAAEETENLDDPEPPMYLCSNHILLEFEEDAQAALDRYNEGEDFAELAMELSTGPSGPNGGDLGCVPEGQFVPEFWDAAIEGAAGEVVGPVQTAFGFHLIEVESVGPATVENHPSADPVELAQLMLQAQQLQSVELIADFETAAIANYGAGSSVDGSIGTLDTATLLISVE